LSELLLRASREASEPIEVNWGLTGHEVNLRVRKETEHGSGYLTRKIALKLEKVLSIQHSGLVTGGKEKKE